MFYLEIQYLLKPLLHLLTPLIDNWVQQGQPSQKTPQSVFNDNTVVTILGKCLGKQVLVLIHFFRHLLDVFGKSLGLTKEKDISKATSMNLYINQVFFLTPIESQVFCSVIHSQTQADKLTSWLKRQVAVSSGRSAVATNKRCSTSSSQVEVAETPSYNFCSKWVFWLLVPPPWGEKIKIK